MTGAVQVPGSGQPLVFLADHPVTGGYPVIAVVDEGELWKCAQLRPGDEVRFAACPLSGHSGDVVVARAGSTDRLGERRVVGRNVMIGPGPVSRGLEPHRHPPEPGTPDPAGTVLGVLDVHPGHPPVPVPRPRLGLQPAASMIGSSKVSSSSPNRSSWIQSARPETPTPSSRTPPEVSTSDEQ